MEIKNTIDYIIRDLREARVIISDFKNYPEIPVLQIELALSKCKSAEELMTILKDSGDKFINNNVIAAPVKVSEPEEVTETIIIKEDKPVITPMAKTGTPLTSGSVQGKRITNLADAISLNEKFIYVKEIFAGDQQAYKDAIKKLNNTGNINDAKAIIMSYTGGIEENESFLKLIELVKRKLSLNE